MTQATDLAWDEKYRLSGLRCSKAFSQQFSYTPQGQLAGKGARGGGNGIWL
nr:hypothetical protein [Mixta theicola]